MAQALVKHHTSVCFEGREHQQQPQHFCDIIAWSLRRVLRAVELAIKGTNIVKRIRKAMSFSAKNLWHTNINVHYLGLHQV